MKIPFLLGGYMNIIKLQKEDLKDIVDNTLDITHDAIVKTSSAIKNAGQETKFCKHCGAQIDSDSRFCSKCGKEQ